MARNILTEGVSVCHGRREEEGPGLAQTAMVSVLISMNQSSSGLRLTGAVNGLVITSVFVAGVDCSSMTRGVAIVDAGSSFCSCTPLIWLAGLEGGV